MRPFVLLGLVFLVFLLFSIPSQETGLGKGKNILCRVDVKPQLNKSIVIIYVLKPFAAI